MKTKTKLILFGVIFFVGVNFTLYISNEDGETERKDKLTLETRIFSKPQINFIKTTQVSIWQRDKENVNSILFDSLAEAYLYMKNTDVEIAKQVIIHYSNFSRHLPYFIDQSDQEIFAKSALNKANLQPTPFEQLRGVVEVVHNGTFKMDFSCGFNSDPNYFKENRTSDFTQEFDVLVPLVIPMGFLFQHFFDGTFPKIIQALEYVKRENTKILIERPHHDNVLRILEKLNITQDKVIWHRRNDARTVYKAKYMISTCVTPPLHPLLWQKMRAVLGVRDVLSVPQNMSQVMLLTRAGASNGGRSAINLNEVYDYLLTRYNKSLVVFDSQMDLNQALEQFSRVKIIIGTHGGAFYNMNYAPLSTTIIEFVPYDYGGRDIRALPHAIFWAMADMLGQPYWRVMCKSENFQNDMKIDLNKLERILNEIDPGTKTTLFS